MLRISLQEKIRVFRVHPCPQNTVSDIVIQAEGLGKKYTIGHQTENGRDVNAKAQRRRDAKFSIFSILPSPFATGRSLRAQGRDLRNPAWGICAKLWYHRDGYLY